MALYLLSTVNNTNCYVFLLLQIYDGYSEESAYLLNYQTGTTPGRNISVNNGTLTASTFHALIEFTRVITDTNPILEVTYKAIGMRSLNIYNLPLLG